MNGIYSTWGDPPIFSLGNCVKAITVLMPLKGKQKCAEERQAAITCFYSASVVRALTSCQGENLVWTTKDNHSDFAFKKRKHRSRRKCNGECLVNKGMKRVSTTRRQQMFETWLQPTLCREVPRVWTHSTFINEVAISWSVNYQRQETTVPA